MRIKNIKQLPQDKDIYLDNSILESILSLLPSARGTDRDYLLSVLHYGHNHLNSLEIKTGSRLYSNYEHMTDNGNGSDLFYKFMRLNY